MRDSDVDLGELHKGFTEGLVTILLATTTTLLHRVTFQRTARIVKLVLTNRGAAQTRLNFGDTADGLAGGAFTQRLAGITVPVGTLVMTEEDLPRVFERFNGANNILAQMSAATTLEISGEVAETDG